MKKILLAMALGAVLGLVDGASAWIEPDARPQIGSIIFWSALKDVVAGFLIGLFAVRVRSKVAVVLFGLLVGLGLAFYIAWQEDAATGNAYYAQIMVPGGLVGVLVGYFTARYGKSVRREVPAT